MENKYVIINAEAIQKRIEELEEVIDEIDGNHEYVLNTKTIKDLFGNINLKAINQFLIWYNCEQKT